MHDYKPEGPDPLLSNTEQMFNDFAVLFRSLRFDAGRALEEVNTEYSTTTELADVLQRDADVPFRAGHHFASELVTYGRANQLRPGEIPYTQAQRLYAETAAAFGLPVLLPITEQEFRRALSAEGMVRASQGLGGPQPAEVARMLIGHRDGLAADWYWVTAARDRLGQAAVKRDIAFAALLS
jgi:argininosuccinate lyase